MFKTVCIDWLSFTSHPQDGMNAFIIPPWENALDGKPHVPRFGYRKATRFSSDCVVMYEGSTDSMGAHYIYSGQALATLNEYFEDGGQHILKWHSDRGHKCTRIDLAIDVKEDSAFLPQIRGKVERNEFTGTARGATIVSSSDGAGLTLYIGSRSSERFVRIYDKAAQMKVDGQWTRIEAEIKHDSARAIARTIVGFGAGGISLVAQSIIRRVCDFDCPAWKAVFDGKTIPIGTPKIEEKKTEEWILSQVAKAIARFEREYPEKRILERLWDTIEDILGE